MLQMMRCLRTTPDTTGYSLPWHPMRTRLVSHSQHNTSTCVVRQCRRTQRCHAVRMLEHLDAPRSPTQSHTQGNDQTTDTPTLLPAFMNTVPHPRTMRQFFYADVSEAVVRGVQARLPRMSVRLTIPETNPEMDVYRIGTLLELVREVATSLAQDGRRVKVCVQQAMGQGVFQGTPLALSGVMRIMTQMDWGDAAEFITWGNYGTDAVDDGADVYLLLAPQNVTGDSVLPLMQDMVAAAESSNKQLVIFNPRLDDIPSANGVMGVRGRKERMEFVDTFEPVYHFRLLYVAGSFWPVMGALRYAMGGQWEIYKRVETGGKMGEAEEYQLLESFPKQPDGGTITGAFSRSWS